MKIKRITRLAALLLPAALLLAACGGGSAPSSAVPQSQPEGGPFVVTSPNVADGVLADGFGLKTGDGAAGEYAILSPAIAFANPPPGTVCFALVMTDPDAVPTAGHIRDHWLAANITGGALPENASAELEGSMVQGLNSFGFVGYCGPTPPPSTTHTYELTACALDSLLALSPGFSKAELEAAMEGHILDVALMLAEYTT